MTTFGNETILQDGTFKKNKHVWTCVNCNQMFQTEDELIEHNKTNHFFVKNQMCLQIRTDSNSYKKP